MSRSKESNRKIAETTRQRHGEDFYHKIGRKGGQGSRGYAFGWGKIDPAVASKMGQKKRRANSREPKLMLY